MLSRLRSREVWCDRFMSQWCCITSKESSPLSHVCFYLHSDVDTLWTERSLSTNCSSVRLVKRRDHNIKRSLHSLHCEILANARISLLHNAMPFVASSKPCHELVIAQPLCPPQFYDLKIFSMPSRKISACFFWKINIGRSLTASAPEPPMLIPTPLAFFQNLISMR